MESPASAISIDVRIARQDDAVAICDVLRRSIIELCEADHGHDRAFLDKWLANKKPEIVTQWIADPDNFLIVATEGDEIAGVASMQSTGRIGLNYVSPSMRFRGVSKALLSALEDEATARGLTQCTLESTKTAMQFYRAQGYAPVGPACGDCTPMVKALQRTP
ncbi:MAG: GNAT family N-acetyltransferase [Proteobacteria bacterium]|nr:GNAT family N-acetyltransferase [Pseudomonadota bacterium]